MKKIITIALLLTTGWAMGQSAEKAFVINDKELIPEGMTFDPVSGNFFVGSIFKQKIVRINKAGKATDFVSSNQNGLLQVLGMIVDNAGKLWACNNSAEHDTINRISNVHVFEIATGKLVRRYQINDGKKHLFNDLFQTRNGDTYITDSDGGAVYIIKNGSEQLEPFLPVGSLVYPNGITSNQDDSKLFISTGSGLGIVTVDVATKKIASVTHPKFFVVGMDGMYRFNNSIIGVQNVTFPEAVLRLGLNENDTEFNSIESLVSDHPMFDSPTTGVIANGYFYFIANAQLLQINGGKGKIKYPEKLKQPVIMKIKLN